MSLGFNTRKTTIILSNKSNTSMDYYYCPIKHSRATTHCLGQPRFPGPCFVNSIIQNVLLLNGKYDKLRIKMPTYYSPPWALFLLLPCQTWKIIFSSSNSIAYFHQDAILTIKRKIRLPMQICAPG